MTSIEREDETMSLMSKIDTLCRKLTLRQRLLFQYVCYRQERECCITFDVLCTLLNMDERAAVQCLLDDMEGLRKLSIWIPIENGEKLIGLINGVEVDLEERRILVRMGEVLDHIT